MNLGSLYISFSTAHNSIQIQIYYRVSYENCENCTVFPFFLFFAAIDGTNAIPKKLIKWIVRTITYYFPVLYNSLWEPDIEWLTDLWSRFPSVFELWVFNHLYIFDKTVEWAKWLNHKTTQQIHHMLCLVWGKKIFHAQKKKKMKIETTKFTEVHVGEKRNIHVI